MKAVDFHLTSSHICGARTGAGRRWRPLGRSHKSTDRAGRRDPHQRLSPSAGTPDRRSPRSASKPTAKMSTDSSGAPVRALSTASAAESTLTAAAASPPRLTEHRLSAEHKSAQRGDCSGTPTPDGVGIPSQPPAASPRTKPQQAQTPPYQKPPKKNAKNNRAAPLNEMRLKFVILFI